MNGNIRICDWCSGEIREYERYESYMDEDFHENCYVEYMDEWDSINEEMEE
jgi:hypothetical protein